MYKEGCLTGAVAFSSEMQSVRGHQAGKGRESKHPNLILLRLFKLLTLIGPTQPEARWQENLYAASIGQPAGGSIKARRECGETNGKSPATTLEHARMSLLHYSWAQEKSH